MKEVSIILKNKLITNEEFRLLHQYSHMGKVWILTQVPTPKIPYKISYRTTEYVFDPEALTLFCIVSRNVLVSWDTDTTKYIKPNQEFYLQDSLFITPYSRH